MMYALTIVPFLLLAPQQDTSVSGYRHGLDALSRASGPAATEATDRQIRIFDVSDLTGADRLDALREAIGNELLDEEVRYAALERYLDLVETGEMDQRARSLVDVIETFCEADTAGLRIGIPSPGELIVAADASVHSWIDRFFASMREFDGHIDIQVAIFRADAGSTADLWGGRSGICLDEASTSDLLKRLTELPDVERMDAPRVLTLPAQRATMFVGEEFAYVQDYVFTLLPGRNVEIADPVIGVIKTGTSIDLIAAPMGDGRLVVEVQFTVATAETPFREFETTMGGRHHSPVTVQLPEVKSRKVEARLELDPGASIGLSLPDPEDETKSIIVVIRASRVPSEPIEDAGPGASNPFKRR